MKTDNIAFGILSHFGVGIHGSYLEYPRDAFLEMLADSRTFYRAEDGNLDLVLEQYERMGGDILKVAATGKPIPQDLLTYFLGVSACIFPPKDDTFGYLLRTKHDGTYSLHRSPSDFRHYFIDPTQRKVVELWEILKRVEADDPWPVHEHDDPSMPPEHRQFMTPAEATKWMTDWIQASRRARRET